jgi:general stress protein 26
MKGNEHEVGDLIRKYHTAILTTRGADGHFHARPMAMQKEARLDHLWFATSADTRKVHDLEDNPECAVSLHESERAESYVSISGHGKIVRDREKIHELWEADWKLWFPDGPDQDDLALICVSPEHLEYVEPEGGKLKVLYSAVKAAVTRRRTEVTPRKDLDVH